MAVAPSTNAHKDTTDAAKPERIPAWKRLGLLLKSAKEGGDCAGPNNGLSSHSFKRSTAEIHPSKGDEDKHNSPAAKKRRVDSHSKEFNHSNSSLAGRNVSLTTPKVNRLKKSVSFTPETKLEDGDSSKTLYADWAESDEDYYSRKAAEYDAKEATEAAAVTQSISNSQNQPEELTKPLNSFSETPHKSRDALEYLSLYHKSRSSWKFQKNREIWILKHILSTEAIPPSFNHPLASYIHGLKSERAKTRLVAECRETLKKEAVDTHTNGTIDSSSATMEDPKRREAYQEEAIRRFKRSFEEHLDEEQRIVDEEDPEYQRFLSRRKRAELLLWAVSSSSFGTEPGSASTPEIKPEGRSSAGTKSLNGAPSNGLEMKRKNRTAIVEDSSSSDEESGSSDSEDDQSDGVINNGVHQHLTDATSSSNNSSDTELDARDGSRSDSRSSLAATDATASNTFAGYGLDATKRHASGKRQASAIPISSRSNASLATASSSSDDISESTSSVDDGSRSDSSTVEDDSDRESE